MPPIGPDAVAETGAGEEKRDRMSCLTSFLGKSAAVEDEAGGAWKSREKRSLSGAFCCGWGVAETGAGIRLDGVLCGDWVAVYFAERS